jgi:hypothetical protein
MSVRILLTLKICNPALQSGTNSKLKENVHENVSAAETPHPIESKVDADESRQLAHRGKYALTARSFAYSKEIYCANPGSDRLGLGTLCHNEREARAYRRGTVGSGGILNKALLLGSTAFSIPEDFSTN